MEYPGAIDHVVSRGERRENICLDEVDRQDFLKTLAEACQQTGGQFHARLGTSKSARELDQLLGA